MWQKVSVAAALLVLTGSGVLHGLWTDRWQTSPDLNDALARVERLPLNVGPWRGQAMPLEARDLVQAGYTGGLWRRFEKSSAGEGASMLLICGRPGPVSVHTPEVCYKGAGYELVGEPSRLVLHPSPPSPPAEFWTARFSQQKALAPGHLRIYWSWYAGGSWQAPDNPRFTFARAPVVYKLYVVCDTPDAGDRQGKNPASELLEYLLPALQDVLPGAEPAHAGAWSGASREASQVGQPSANGRRGRTGNS